MSTNIIARVALPFLLITSLGCNSSPGLSMAEQIKRTKSGNWLTVIWVSPKSDGIEAWPILHNEATGIITSAKSEGRDDILAKSSVYFIDDKDSASQLYGSVTFISVPPKIDNVVSPRHSKQSSLSHTLYGDESRLIITFPGGKWTNENQVRFVQEFINLNTREVYLLSATFVKNGPSEYLRKDGTQEIRKLGVIPTDVPWYLYQ